MYREDETLTEEKEGNLTQILKTNFFDISLERVCLQIKKMKLFKEEEIITSDFESKVDYFLIFMYLLLVFVEVHWILSA